MESLRSGQKSSKQAVKSEIINLVCKLSEDGGLLDGNAESVHQSHGVSCKLLTYLFGYSSAMRRTPSWPPLLHECPHFFHVMHV